MRARFRLITEERDCAWVLAISFLASKGQNYWNMEPACTIGKLQMQKPSAYQFELQNFWMSGC